MTLLDHPPRFLIASIVPQNLSEEESFENIRELIHLIEVYGGEVVDIVLQKREVHDKGMYLGAGKTDEVNELIKTKEIDIVVLNGIVAAGQLFELNTLFYQSNPDIQIWDRVDLILKIFAQRAFTAEGKLQIELAAMRHMGPRMFGMGSELSRQGGGIGTRGIGETNTELMKRHWRNEIKNTEEKLSKLTEQRQKQMDRRKELGLKTVSLVGYTNSGKTTLFNQLTKKHKFAENALFATLDAYLGKIYIQSLGKEVLISDTIGFIRDLPPKLIDAFKSTLLESVNADLVIHLIDSSDKDMYRKIIVVERTLLDIEIDLKDVLFVFNKIDQADLMTISKVKKEYPNAMFISAQTKEGLDDLLEVVGKRLL